MTGSPKLMPSASHIPQGPLVLICGDDDHGVKQRARSIQQEWVGDGGSCDLEVVEGAVSNAQEALKVLGRLNEALQTLPFLMSSKVVWLRDCNFLGDERAAETQAVTERLGALAQELKAFKWGGVRLLVSAGKVDKRKSFYKTVEKMAVVEEFKAWSINDRDWQQQAEQWVRQTARAQQAEMDGEAVAALVAQVGPNRRMLESEIEKLALYAAGRAEIVLADVRAIATRSKQARAFALGDALGDRDLPRLLRCLDEELWDMQFDKDKSEIGMLYGLIGKVRAMLFLKAMLQAGWLKPVRDYNSFKAQFERIPSERLPEDKRFNPKYISPYVFFTALPQVTRYTEEELVRAMEVLLACNLKLISSGSDARRAIEQALVAIVGTQPGKAAPARR